MAIRGKLVISTKRQDDKVNKEREREREREIGV